MSNGINPIAPARHLPPVFHTTHHWFSKKQKKKQTTIIKCLAFKIRKRAKQLQCSEIKNNHRR